MANPGYFDSALQIVDGVDDPIIPSANAPLGVAAFELLAAYWARIVSQIVDALQDSVYPKIRKLLSSLKAEPLKLTVYFFTKLAALYELSLDLFEWNAFL
jgi:hypothetical protein